MRGGERALDPERGVGPDYAPGPPAALAAERWDALLVAAAFLAVYVVWGSTFLAIAGGPSPGSLLAFGYLVVFGSVVTFGAYVWLLERVGPVRLSSHTYVNAVVAVALGAALAGEAVTGPLLGAMALILGSVVLLVRRDRPRGSVRRWIRGALLAPRR